MSKLSRVEEILQATIDGEEYTDIPQSRTEELLIELKEVIEEGGGGGGTTVVPNPSGEATDDLKKVKIGSDIFAIPESIPNPSGEATEELDKIQIGSTIYDIVGSGGSEPVYGEASGTVASFSDGSANPLADLKVAIEPVQSGSGDPSPTNVRPISGWNSLGVNVTGKNLFDENFADWEARDSYLVLDKKLPSNVELNMSFTDSDTSVDLNGIYLGFISNFTSGAPVTYRWIIQNGSIGTSKSNLVGSVYCNQLFIYPNNEATFNMIKQRYNIQVEVGSTATDYEPYNGETYTTSLGRTVYGGTVDLVSGVLTVTDGYIASYDGETLPSTWISDRDVYASGATPTTGAEVVYKLATPTTIQLTPTEVRSLLGTNNIWSDTGDSNVAYVRNLNLFLNQLDARVKALENA